MTNTKKNILYLGPYKHTHYLGQLSLRNIHELMRSPSLNVIPKHIHIDSSDVFDASHIISDTITSIDNIEKIDLIIQNLPLDFLTSNTYTQNIVIPFLNPYINYSNTDLLDNYDYVLVDDQYTKDHLSHKNTNIQIYEQTTPIIINNCNNERYNLGAYDSLYKYGFIGHYAKESSVVQKLIQSFLTALRTNNNAYLFILLTATEKEKSELETFYNTLKQSLKITNYDKVLFMYNGCGHIDSIRFLNNIDCYVSLNTYTKYSMYEKYCKEAGKSYITYKDIDYISMPIIPVNDIKDLQLKQQSPTTDGIGTALVQVLNAPPKYRSKNQNKSLSDIVCKIIQ